MSRSDAEILWETARVLARDAAEVSHGRALPPLLFFTDPARTPRPWETADRLPAGSGVVYRAFGAPDAADDARRIADALSPRDGKLLIGLDADLAERVGAHGVHLPERALGQAETLRQARPDWILTGAAHDDLALARCGVLDAAVLSPVFPAGGASGARPALGLMRFGELVARAPCPVYALGGVDTKNAPDLIGSGACGIAGVGALKAAFDPD